MSLSVKGVCGAWIGGELAVGTRFGLISNVSSDVAMEMTIERSHSSTTRVEASEQPELSGQVSDNVNTAADVSVRDPEMLDLALD